MSVQIGQLATPAMLRDANRELLEPYGDAELEEAIQLMATEMPEEQDPDLTLEESDEVAFRRQEHEALQKVRREPQLSVSPADLADYDERLSPYFERILLVDRLRETRVLTGFNRIYPEQPLGDDARLAQLWRHVPEWRDRWLPAYKVFGEGIFIELNLDRVAEWSAGADVTVRAAAVEHRYGDARAARQLRPRHVTPSFLLLHTFAHLLINQLTFECGYSTAALRERLYISEAAEAPMAGVLIYTAAGDAEGTMGGLVRMGKPGYLEPAILAALRSALWCSADPVCMEIGTQSGQGPDSCKSGRVPQLLPRPRNRLRGVQPLPRSRRCCRIAGEPRAGLLRRPGLSPSSARPRDRHWEWRWPRGRILDPMLPSPASASFEADIVGCRRCLAAPPRGQQRLFEASGDPDQAPEGTIYDGAVVLSEEVPGWPPIETSACGRPGFWRERTPAVFGHRAGIGPLIVAPDTNILISLRQEIDEVEGGAGLIIGPQWSDRGRPVDSLRDLLQLWWWRDVRFWVCPLHLRDARKPLSEERRAAREAAVRELERDFFERATSKRLSRMACAWRTGRARSMPSRRRPCLDSAPASPATARRVIRPTETWCRRPTRRGVTSS
jgi:hypothetical protein